MSLSQPRALFGIHSVTPYSRSNGMPYGILKVLAGSTFSLESELIELTGGSQKYPWAIEEGMISGELSCKVKEYPDFLWELFLGKAPTAAGADTAGTVSTLTNKYGTSTKDASTGIASVSVIPSTGAANLKFGKYVVKVVSSTTVKVYCTSDLDFNRGTDLTFNDDDLEVTTAAQTITTGGTTDIASIGIRLTGGAGTIGMTTGDTATFEVLPPSTESMSVTIGGVADTWTEFGAIVMSEQLSNGAMFEVDVFKCRGAGMPLGMEMNAWVETELKIKLMYDSTLNGVAKMRHINPS